MGYLLIFKKLYKKMKRISFVPDTLVEEFELQVGEGSPVACAAVQESYTNILGILLDDEHAEAFADLSNTLHEEFGFKSCIVKDKSILYMLVSTEDGYHFEVDDEKVVRDDKSFITIRVRRETEDVTVSVESE